MAKKKTRSDSPTTTGRFKYLFDTLFSANQSKMAEAIGCSQSVVSKILLAQQEPGQRVLSALAAHPRVNPAWLFAGEGEPLVVEKHHEELNPGLQLPVIKRPLPGLPSESPAFLGNGFYPVARAHFRPGRYWFEVQRDDPVVAARNERIAHGDLLLMDCNRELWPTPAAIFGRICFAKVRVQKSTDVKLGVIAEMSDESGEPQQVGLNTFDLGMRDDELTKRFIIDDGPSGPQLRTQYVRKGETGDHRRPVGLMRVSPPLPQIQLSDIVALCVLVVRRFK